MPSKLSFPKVNLLLIPCPLLSRKARDPVQVAMKFSGESHEDYPSETPHRPFAAKALNTLKTKHRSPLNSCRLASGQKPARADQEPQTGV